MSALESRVARLERQLRFQRAATALALLALVALTGWGALQSPPEVIRARRFEVINRTGRPLVTLLTNEYGGLVQTLGNDGVSGVSLGASSTGGMVGERDAKPSLFPRCASASTLRAAISRSRASRPPFGRCCGSPSRRGGNSTLPNGSP